MRSSGKLILWCALAIASAYCVFMIIVSICIYYGPQSTVERAVSDGDRSRLIQLLNHRNPEFRWRAALTLGNSGDPQALPALRRTLKDQDDFVRVHAVFAVWKIEQQYETAVPQLIQELSKGVSSGARRQAAGFLGEIGSGAKEYGADHALIDALNDPDPVVRAYAAEAIWRVKPEMELAIPGLLEALRDDSPNVRRAAVSALALLRQDVEYSQYFGYIVAALKQLQDDPDPRVRWEVDHVLKVIMNCKQANDSDTE